MQWVIITAQIDLDVTDLWPGAPHNYIVFTQVLLKITTA